MKTPGILESSPQAIKRSFRIAGAIFVVIGAFALYSDQFRLAHRHPDNATTLLLIAILLLLFIVTPFLLATIGSLRVIAISPLLITGPVFVKSILVAGSFAFSQLPQQSSLFPIASKEVVRGKSPTKYYVILAAPIPKTEYIKIQVSKSLYYNVGTGQQIKVWYEVGRFGFVNILNVQSPNQK